jgi:uncharacterized membrane protein
MLAATSLALFVYVRLAVVRWDAFETNAFDLGFFDQIIFNTSRGRWFETSFVGYNFLGQHFEPVLLLFVPAYWFGGGPLLLTVTQAVAASAAAIPLYFLARRLDLGALPAFAAAAAYLFNPYLQRALGFDFHPEVMAALPAFLAAWAIVAGRTRIAVAITLSLLLFKEDTVFMVLALAGFMWLRNQRRPAIATAAVASLYVSLSVLLLMPLAREGKSSDLVERYGYLLPGNRAFPVDAILAPFRAVREISEPRQLLTIALFLSISAPVAVMKPKVLLALVPGLALALLASHPQQRHLELHYAAELVPIALIASLLGAQAMLKYLDGRIVAGLLLAPALIATVLMDPFGASHGSPPSSQHVQALEQGMSLIPSDENVQVSAQSGLVPRVSQRIQVHEFPGHIPRADYVIVDKYGFRSSQSINGGFDETLALVRSTYTEIYSADGVEVFRKIP